MQLEQIPVIRVRTKAFTTVTLELFPTEPVTCGLICAVFYKATKKQKLLGETFCPFCFFTVFVLKLFVIFILERII